MSDMYETIGKRVRHRIQFVALLAALSGMAKAGGLSSDCNSAKAHIPLWQITGTSAGDLCFVGYPPTKAGASTADIRALVVPVKIVLVDISTNKIVVLDPKAPLSVPVNFISGYSALDALLDSPIFKNHDWRVGSTDLGSTQWGEATERASFLNYPGTDFTNWHVHLGPDQQSEQTVGGWLATPSTKVSGAYQVDEAALKPVLELLAFSYASSHPNAVPILLTYNVEKSNASGCCARGYHAHVTDKSGYNIPYIWASYIDSDPYPDLNALSHEVAEFMHNPMNINQVTPAWPEASGTCNSGFEVGDPIESLAQNKRLFSITMPTMTYNFQNVVTASWFMRAKPAFSVNKQYAFPNEPDSEFGAPAPTCSSSK